MSSHRDHSQTPAIEEQEPTADGLTDVISELPLIRVPNRIDEEYCSRCAAKNNIRRRYDLPRRDGGFDDRERVRMICGWTDGEDTDGWVIRAAYHTDHPTVDKDGAASPGQALAQVTAALDRTGWTYTWPPRTPGDEPTQNHVEDRSVLRDVDVEWFSPIEHGEPREPIREPTEHGVVELRTTDPRPSWPDEENAWRQDLLKEHDDWNDEVDRGGPVEI